MPNLPISGLPAITVPSKDYILAAVSASVTSQMTVAQVAAAISSSFTASQAISASYAVSASYEVNYETSSSYADTASFVTASNVYGPFGSNSIISASYAVTSSYSNTSTSASYAVSASYSNTALTASYALNAAPVFPYTGSAIISGSLLVTGSLNVTGSVSAVTLYAGFNGFSLGNGGGNSISNIGIGRLSLSSNTSGANNLAVGNTAMQANTIGNDNVAVGQNAMASSTSGFENVAVGYQTLLSVSTGNNNTAVGANALQVATGQNNTAVGNRAAFYLTSGDNNTIVGRYSGSYGMSAINSTIIIADGQGTIGYKYSGSRAEITGSISQTSVTNSLIKADANGTLVAAVGGTDYTPPAYLSSYHTASLIVPTPNTPNTMSFSTVDFSQNVTISGSWSDKIKMTNGGIYNIQFSVATTKTTGTTATMDIWLRKNGNNLSYTNTIVTLAGGANDFAIPAWNFFVSASAGDYYQLMFASPTTNPYIAYAASGSTGVAVQVPSVILTVNRVG